LLSSSGNSASFEVGGADPIPIQLSLASPMPHGTAVGIQVAGIEEARHNLTSAATPAGWISDPVSVPCNCVLGITTPGPYKVYATNIPSNVTTGQVEWDLIPPNGWTTPYWGKNPTVQLSQLGVNILQMRWDGECGYSPYATREVLVTASDDFGGDDFGDDFTLFISAYPNPVSSILYIEPAEALQATLQSQQSSLSSAGVYRVQLVAVHGAVALNQTVSSFNGVLPLDVSTIPDGLYILTLTRNNTVLHTENILIQH
jgi:hypothetical protein